MSNVKIEHDLRIARDFKTRLSSKIPLVELRLFGSRARGDAEPDSDMDIFVEVNEISGSIRDIIDEIAWEVGFEHLMHISPLVFTKEEIDSSPHRASPIVQNIMLKGIKI